MSLHITRRDLEEAFNYANKIHKTGSGLREHGEYVVGTAAAQAESGLAAFGYGVLEGRMGPVKVGPVSGDLLAGLALHLAGFSGYAGKMRGHAHNFAQGLMDGYLHRLGIGVGTTMGMAAGHTAISTTDPKGAFAVGGSAPALTAGQVPLTQAEIAALAQTIR